MSDRPYSRTIERVRAALAGTFAETDTWFDRPEPLRSFRPSDGDAKRHVDQMRENEAEWRGAARNASRCEP